MNILGILKGLLGAITAAILTLSGASAASPAAIQQVATTTDAVVQQAAQEATTTTSDDVVQAYELGKQVGRLQAKAEQITPSTTTTMTNDSTAGAPTSAAPSTTAATQTQAPVPTAPSAPAPVAAAAPASQAHIDIINPLPGKGLGRQYVHADEEKDESNYMVIGAVVYDDNGQPIATPNVQVTATDASQNQTMQGTGDVATIWPDGNRTVVPVYTYSYNFKTPGDHTITFSANGLTKSVTVTVK